MGPLVPVEAWGTGMALPSSSSSQTWPSGPASPCAHARRGAQIRLSLSHVTRAFPLLSRSHGRRVRRGRVQAVVRTREEGALAPRGDPHVTLSQENLLVVPLRLPGRARGSSPEGAGD